MDHTPIYNSKLARISIPSGDVGLAAFPSRLPKRNNQDNSPALEVGILKSSQISVGIYETSVNAVTSSHTAHIFYLRFCNSY